MIIKEVLYIKEVKKKKCFPLQSIVYPLVEFEPNYNKKDLFLLSNNKFIEVLNCVQFTAMESLF